MGETYPAFCCSSDRAIVLDIFSHEMFETDASIFGKEMILGVRYKRREERERMKRDCWKNTQQFRRSRYFLFNTEGSQADCCSNARWVLVGLAWILPLRRCCRATPCALWEVVLGIIEWDYREEH
jgi:hypothetical protein